MLSLVIHLLYISLAWLLKLLKLLRKFVFLLKKYKKVLSMKVHIYCKKLLFEVIWLLESKEVSNEVS